MKSLNSITKKQQQDFIKNIRAFAVKDQDLQVKFDDKDKKIEALENDLKSLNSITTNQRQKFLSYQKDTESELQANKIKTEKLENDLRDCFKIIDEKAAKIEKLE